MTAKVVPRARHAIDVVEAAYSIVDDDGEWLARLLTAVAHDLELGAGIYAFTGKLRSGAIDMQRFEERGVAPEFLSTIARMNRDIPPEALASFVNRASIGGGLLEHYGDRHPTTLGVRSAGAPFGIIDAFSLFAQDVEHNAVNVTALAKRPVATAPRVGAIWKRVGVHITSGARLRARIAGHTSSADALLDAKGVVRHAESDVSRSRSARAVLSDAVQKVERARTARVRADPERALSLWRGLVAGKWSLVDHWESDGKRYIAAFHNEPEVADPRGLSPQERTIARLVGLGESNKEIAFGIGVSIDSIDASVTRILRKLRCARRTDLVVLANPSAWDTATLATGAGELAVARVDALADPSAMARLTRAQRSVARDIVRGLTNGAIAERRGTSARTIANQVRAIFATLDVGSRAELVRALMRIR